MGLDNGWKWDWIREPSSAEECDQFQRLSGLLHSVTIDENKKDVWRWDTKDGASFSTKSVQAEIAVENDTNSEDSLCWNSWAPLKSNYLLWRALKGKVADKISLEKRGIPIRNHMCDRCGYGIEDTNHVFVNCIWARIVWWQIVVWMRIPPPINLGSLKEVVDVLTGNIGSARWRRIVYTVILATVWRIWNARNLKVFEGQFVSTLRTVDLVKEDVYLWIAYRTKLPKLEWDKWADFNVLDIL
ncbi:uncharacterized protein LOC110944640 [Helianthus annuus]|uniref:uncharacterized protein LOC110944640 n=1 Tax=Helianthus annuus TaxID=4232 RepID=UPI000B8FC321|nr:uncharacterized protein LOC110944640 [Helianthus annuus]